MKKPVKRTRLTMKQGKLLKGVAKGKTITQAAVDAGYSKGTAGVIGSQTLKSIALRAPEVLEANGLSLDEVVKNHLKPMLQARETKFFQHEGKVTAQRRVEAWEPRRAALDMTLRMHGAYSKNGHDYHGAGTGETAAGAGPITVNLAVLTRDAASRVLASITNDQRTAVLAEELHPHEG